MRNGNPSLAKEAPFNIDKFGLGDRYEETFERNQWTNTQEGEKVEFAATTLFWICHSERLL